MENKLKQYKVTILCPGGNDTALVEGLTSGKDRRLLNDRIMKMFPSVEQIGFYEYDQGKKEAVLEMAGREFCGNATRSTAWQVLQGQPGTIDIKVSNVANKLKAGVTESGEAFAQMPIYDDPKYITEDPDKPGNYTVRLEGITHYLDFNTKQLEGLTEDQIKEKGMQEIRQRGLDKEPAAGTIYVKKDNGGYTITPVVYVRDMDTLYLETACGSGTAALGLVLALQKGESIKDISIKQPSGLPIKVSVAFDGKRFGYTQIQGSIEKLNEK
ncbi:MAG TPA: hypothetical protein VMR41_05030 [Patescibacteria group bacterium]|nr:hypothetical protein [Patescibacteria group bacterium]